MDVRHHSTDVVFTFALRAGDVMLRNGASAADVTHVLLAVTRSLGYPSASAGVTLGQISLSLVRPEAGQALTLVHHVGATTFDLKAISDCEEIVRHVITGAMSPEEGRERLTRIGHRRRSRAVMAEAAGWAVMAVGFAWLLGGGVAACLAAAGTAVVVEVVSGELAQYELPSFFAHVLAGAAAVAAAVAVQAIAPGQTPALVITSALVSRLAGGSTLGAAQDLLTGWYLNAAGRLFEIALNTCGQVVGVILGAGIARRVGMGLNIEAAPGLNPNFGQAVVAAVVVAVGFAVASHLPWMRLAVIAALTAAVYTVYLGMQSWGWGRMIAAATASAVLGIVSVLAARTIRVPSAGLLGLALAPLLPGTLVYEGFVSVALHHTNGATTPFLRAAGVALSTGAGAVLGQYLATEITGIATATRRRRLIARAGEDVAFDPHADTIRWLSAPIFRRPYYTLEVTEDLAPTDDAAAEDAVAVEDVTSGEPADPRGA